MTKIVKRKLADEVSDRLLEMINSGQFKPGETLPSERELMERFGVGRPSIREAMQSLQTVGLIDVNHGQRPKVTQPTAMGMFEQIDIAARHLLGSSPSSLEHLKDARLLLEVGIVRHAAEKATAEDETMMQAALDRQKKYYMTDADKFLQADMDFHAAIAETTQNPIFIASSHAMLVWLQKFHSKVVRLEGEEHISLVEHQRIFDLIVAKNPDGAAHAMTDHLNRSREVYRNKK